MSGRFRAALDSLRGLFDSTGRPVLAGSRSVQEPTFEEGDENGEEESREPEDTRTAEG